MGCVESTSDKNKNATLPFAGQRDAENLSVSEDSDISVSVSAQSWVAFEKNSRQDPNRSMASAGLLSVESRIDLNDLISEKTICGKAQHLLSNLELMGPLSEKTVGMCENRLLSQTPDAMALLSGLRV